MAGGDSYSRAVQVSKIVLPLAALFILSTLFLIPNGIDPDKAIPYAKVDVEKIAREQRLTNPRFATVGEDGAVIEISAAEARPNPEETDRIDATEISGLIELPGGANLSLKSGGAVVNMAQQAVGLTDEVKIISSTGYSIQANQLLASLERAELRTDGPVWVETPFGTMEAGNMLLTRTGTDYRLVFNNKVKLVYLP